MYGREVLEKAVEWHPESKAARALLDNFHHFVELGPSFHHGCGSYMMNGQDYTYQLETLRKQEALFHVGERARHVLEVGVYLGHSLLILLCSNPDLRVTCIDNDPQFSPSAVDYLNLHFGNRITFILGDAIATLETLPAKTFDTIHIDADHLPPAVSAQFYRSIPLAKPGATIVFDDYEATKELIDSWISRGILTHVTTPWCLWTNIVTRLT